MLRIINQLILLLLTSVPCQKRKQTTAVSGVNMEESVVKLTFRTTVIKQCEGYKSSILESDDEMCVYSRQLNKA